MRGVYERKNKTCRYCGETDLAYIFCGDTCKNLYKIAKANSSWMQDVHLKGLQKMKKAMKKKIHVRGREMYSTKKEEDNYV